MQVAPVAHNQNWWYVAGMSRSNLDGRPIKRVLEWLLNRDLTDADLAAALGTPAPTYSRHKDDDDFPNFAELEQLADAFGVSDRMLQIAFGWRKLDELSLLGEDEMRQWRLQGGCNHPPPKPKNGRPKYEIQKDKPGLDRP